MNRLNFLADEPWDEVDDADRTRVRWFGHPFGADILGASLRELLPGSPGGSLHMHYGVEEMFFVLAGTPTVPLQPAKSSLPLEMSSTSLKALTACTTSRTRPMSRFGFSLSLPSGFRMLWRTPSRESPGSRLAILSGRLLKAATRESSLASTYRRVTDGEI